MRIRYIVFVLFTLLMVVMPFHIKFAYHESKYMDEYFLMNAQRETGSNNVVSAVVFDYRAFDTLGEATILFVCVLSILFLIGDKNEHNS